MSDGSSSSGGIGVLGLLGLLFVALKLGGVIDWSWWYVTMPFWGGIALFLAMLTIVGFISLVTIMVASAVAWFQTRKMAKLNFEENKWLQSGKK